MEIGSAQKKILGAMFLVLVISLSLITFASSRKTKEFPPTLNQCPDFFTFDGTNCVAPSIYPNISPLDITSTTSEYVATNANSLCKKKAWALTNSVTWDGITNNDTVIPCP
jgi:hypothetical protein